MASSTAAHLLDAAIETLIEDGYAATTTRRVAERAGVSQGALQHHYRTKAQLVHAALARVTERLLQESSDSLVDERSERARAAAVIDRILAIHQLPITPAVLELYTAARTDSDLGPHAAIQTAAAMRMIISAAAAMLPTYAARPGFEDVIQLTFAAARGTVLVSTLPNAQGTHPTWQAVREHFVAALDAL